MLKPENKLDFTGGNSRAEGLLVDSICQKIEEEIARFQPVNDIVSWVSDAAKVTVAAIPFAYPKARSAYYAGVQRMEDSGIPYAYKPEKLIHTALLILEQQGKLTPAETEFVTANHIAFRRLILQRVKMPQTSPFIVNNPEEETPSSPTFYERTVHGFFDKGIQLLGLRRQPSSAETTIKNQNVIRWEEMSGVDLLGLNVYETARILGKNPQASNSIFGTREGYFDDPKNRERYTRRLDSIDSQVPGDNLMKATERDQKALLRRVNKVWEQILEYIFDKKENRERFKFKGIVGDCQDVFELHGVLDTLRSASGASRESLEEIDMARIKLVLYITTKIAKDLPQYRFKHSIKEYLDGYLTKNIFKVTGEEEVRAKVVSIGDVKEEGLREAPKVKVLRAKLTDPDTEEVMEVYLYKGKDSEHPDDQRFQTGVVNTKSLAKIVLKMLTKREEPIDIHRITVMPVISSDEELSKMRRILGKTILHPQKLHISAFEEETNQASAYGNLDIRRDCTTLVPGGGHIVDTHSKKTVQMSRIVYEVRHGKKEHILSENHPDDETHHGVYSRIRMLPAINGLISPEEYPENWISRAVGRFQELRESLDDGKRTLPGWTQLYIMEKFLQNLLKKNP